ncbi:MAG TPA: glutamine synthetase family protein [Gaiellaceae bacterium]|nr:glutamine synthetase family protein [Gaiellaceae bacterium]
MRSDSTPIEYVLRSAEEQGVRFVRLWFVDVLGLLKSSSIPISELEEALTEGVGLDGSSLESGTRLFELDAIAYPDPTTFELLPWRPDAAVARMFCDIKLPDGTPSPGDSREALRRQLRRVAELGYTFQVGPEIEFFLFESKLGGEPPTPLDEGSYFDQTPLDDGSDFRRATIQYLEQMGIPIKVSHHEVGASQHEMDLKHTDALTMADAITTFRLTAKEVAREIGAFATFMPKPVDGLPGSGMHLHLSLIHADSGRDAFYDEDPGTLLSPVGRAFLAGVLRHARELTVMTNQWVNSYKRLLSGFEAPATISWARHSRSALVRVPSNRPGKESAARIELRSPDAACNPYLALALICAAGLRGIEGGYELQPELDPDQLEEQLRLPADLGEALDAFEVSELGREVLGEQLFGWFVRNKRSEWDEYRTVVTDHERKTFPGLL